jgi:RecA/RadA recombinase
VAYPTGMLSFVLEGIDSRALKIKNYCQSLRTASLSGPVQSGQIISVFQALRQDRAALVAASSTPGLAQYAKDQKNNQTLDVVAEFNTMIAAIDQVTAWIDSNFPKDATTQALLERTLSTEGPIERTFTSVQTAGLRTQLDSLIATIN